MKMALKKQEKTSLQGAKKQAPVILFGNHLALFLAHFLPVNHLVTTKNWVKIGLVTSNFIKPYEKKSPEKLRFFGAFEHF